MVSDAVVVAVSSREMEAADFESELVQESVAVIDVDGDCDKEGS